jgi:plastocyanin
MSDETPPEGEAEPATETAAAPATPEAAEASATPEAPETPDAGGAVATIVDAPVAHPAAPVERVTFRSKFLMPLLVPLAVAATIIFYILNVSRVFLAVGGSVAVTYAAIITIVILVGGSALSASPKLRSSSITLMIGGAFLLLLMGGLVSIGAASPKVASGPVQCSPVKATLTIDAGVGGGLDFVPNTPTVKGGCVKISLTESTGSHTFQFDDAAVASKFEQLTANQKSWAGVLPPGKWAFHCTVDSHAASGMVGTLTVTS